MNSHLLFPVLFILVLALLVSFYKFTNHILDKIEERKHADHHRR